MPNALEIMDLTAGYHGKSVLAGISLSVAEGEMVALLGPNGSGKTTLMRAITGSIQASNGSLKLFGREITSIPPEERAKLVAIVPQEIETPMSFTVSQMVMMGRTAYLGSFSAPGAGDRLIVERAMIYTDTADMKNRFFDELSGGERQRVIVAMAIAQEAKMILLDEATSHLDLNHRLEVMQLIERLNREQGVTVIAISHDLNMSAEFCKRLVLIDHGRIVSDGTSDTVFNEDTLRDVYHTQVRTQKDSMTGIVRVTPAPRLVPSDKGRGKRIHVIAGGGTGEEVMRLLSLSGCRISCGVLNDGDTDADTATALGAVIIREKPFSPISREAFTRAISETKDTEAVVICGVPIGTGNLINLEIAEQAVARGVAVYVMAGIKERDYTPGAAASAKADSLFRNGAKAWKTPPELLNILFS